MIDQKVTFTPLRGDLQTKTDATVKVVQESTKVIFEVVPEHAVYTADKPEIVVEFPQAVQIKTLQCDISEVSMSSAPGAPIAAQCFRRAQTFKVKTFLP